MNYDELYNDDEAETPFFYDNDCRPQEYIE